MVLFGPPPYTKKISTSTLKEVVNKMGSFKGKRGLHASEFKKLCDTNPTIKKNSYLSGVAHNIYKSLSGAGPGDIKIKTGDAQRFIKAFGKSLKSAGDIGLKHVRPTKMGRGLISSPKSAFQKRVIEEQIKKDKPEGPAPEEIEKQKKEQEGLKRFHQWERAREIEKEQGPPLRVRYTEEDKEKRATMTRPEEETPSQTDDQGKKVTPVPFAQGTPLPSTGESDTATRETGEDERKEGIFSQDQIEEKDSGEEKKKGPKVQSEDKKEEDLEGPDTGGLFED